VAEAIGEGVLHDDQDPKQVEEPGKKMNVLLIT
jgi:hypothetical protein